MKKNAKWLFLLTITGLLMMVGMWGTITEKKMPALFDIEVIVEGKSETIAYWTNANGEIIIFLPAYVQMTDARFKLTTDVLVTLDGIRITDNMNCDVFKPNVLYELVCEDSGMLRRTNLMFVKSDKVATMFIDTQSGSMDYIHAQKGNEEAGKIRLYLLDGTLSHTGDIKAIKGRGNSTWSNYEKKPYGIELEQEANLLDMGEAKKWVLMANAADPSHMRNKMVYDFAAQIGLEYSPESQWVDLYLNEEYKGLYLLSEKNEIHPQRVNLTGNEGMLVSVEIEERLIDGVKPYVKTAAGQSLRIHSPQDPSQEEKHKVQFVFQSIENALEEETGIDPKSGKHWKELIDLDSWVKKYLIEEIFASYDACFASQYFYYDKQAEGRVYAGPVWDYDLSMGNLLYWQHATPEEYYAYRLEVQEGDQRPWFYELNQKEEFRNSVRELFRQEFLSKLNVLINTEMDNHLNNLVEPAKMDQIRWNTKETMQDGVCRMKEYMQERLAFLRRIWVDNESRMILQVNPVIAHYVYYAVKPGNCFTELPELGDTADQSFFGWYYEGTDEPFDPTRPIYEDTAVYAKWEDTPYKKLEQVKKLLPAGIIAIMFLAIFAADVRRMRKGG